jgi:hypothetical protein
MAALRESLAAEHRFIRRQLVGMARSLRDGHSERLLRGAERVAGQPAEELPYPALDGYRAMTRQLAANVDDMRQRLAKTAPRWNFAHSAQDSITPE